MEQALEKVPSVTPPYTPELHDNLLKEGSWVLKFPILVNRLQTWIEKEKEKPSLPPTNPFTMKNSLIYLEAKGHSDLGNSAFFS